MNLLLNIQNTVITIMPVFILVAGYSNESMAQKLQLVIGKYDCTKNDDCASNQYCDIDKHICINYEDRANCPTCLEPECPEVTCPMVPSCPDLSEYIKPDECPTLLTCLDGEYNLNGTCVKCISNNDCSGDTPVCGNDYVCETCTDGTHWNGAECIQCNNEMVWSESEKSCVAKKCTVDTETGDVPVCSDDEFCYLNSYGTEYSGECKKVINYVKTPNNTTAYVLSNAGMYWFSAKQFCVKAAKNKELIKARHTQLNLDSFGGILLALQSGGYGCVDSYATGYCGKSAGVYTTVMKNIQNAYSGYRNNTWTSTALGISGAYSVHFSTGLIGYDSQFENHFVACK